MLHPHLAIPSSYPYVRQGLCRRRLACAAQSLAKVLRSTCAIASLAEAASASEAHDLFRSWTGNAHACAALAAALRDREAAMPQLMALATAPASPTQGFARRACTTLLRSKAIRLMCERVHCSAVL